MTCNYPAIPSMYLACAKWGSSFIMKGELSIKETGWPPALLSCLLRGPRLPTPRIPNETLGPPTSTGPLPWTWKKASLCYQLGQTWRLRWRPAWPSSRGPFCLSGIWRSKEFNFTQGDCSHQIVHLSWISEMIFLQACRVILWDQRKS